MAALKKLVDYWNLNDKLNLTIDPCNKDATWAPENENPRIACECSSTVCHINHLFVDHHYFTRCNYLCDYSLLYLVNCCFITLFRKIYALDISGEIPRELFELKELMDL